MPFALMLPSILGGMLTMIDWLIHDALVVDGTGGPPVIGDIAISGDRIAGVGNPGNLEVKHHIRADGLVATPGFIDMHSHSDVLFLNGSSLLHKICQGVTTELIGQDGMSAAPLTETSRGPMAEMLEPLAGSLRGEWRPWGMDHFLQTLEEKKPSINVATLVGHCNLRLAVMGYRMALPTPEELRRMGELLATSLKQGALGLSLGIYPPSSYSDLKELIYLGKVVREQDALIVVHMRDEQEQIFEAIAEMITVGRESGCKVHLSHLKCLGRKNWGRMPEILEMLEDASREGVALTFDQYPYTAACTSLSVLLPSSALEGGWRGLQQRLGEAETSDRILVEMKKSIENRGGEGAITIASLKTSKNQKYCGKTLGEVSGEKAMPSEKAALELIVEEQLQVIAIYHSISEPDVERAMAHPLQTVGSDGIMGAFPHPRAFGTFPRVIRYFCREKKLFPIEEAVRKMTRAPAKRLNLKDRGQIAPGYYADILLFAPEQFKDTATFENPKQFATGLDWVFVNGVAVIERGKIEERFPGHILKKS
jgi:N-acyl-D-amino-acid deacylase